MTDEDGREDIARAVESLGYLVVVDAEIGTFGDFLSETERLVAASTDDAAVAVDAGAGDQSRPGSKGNEAVEHAAGLRPIHAFGAERNASEVARLGVVGESEVGHADHFAHEFHLVLAHTVVEMATVAHDRVDKNGGALTAELTAVGRHQPGLFLTEHQPRTHCIETEAQLAPHGDGATHVLGGFKHIELAIVERIRHQGGGQVEGSMTHVGQDGHHGRHAYMAMAHHVVHKQYLSHIT